MSDFLHNQTLSVYLCNYKTGEKSHPRAQCHGDLGKIRTPWQPNSNMLKTTRKSRGCDNDKKLYLDIFWNLIIVISQYISEHIIAFVFWQV